MEDLLFFPTHDQVEKNETEEFILSIFKELPNIRISSDNPWIKILYKKLIKLNYSIPNFLNENTQLNQLDALEKCRIFYLVCELHFYYSDNFRNLHFPLYGIDNSGNYERDENMKSKSKIQIKGNENLNNLRFEAIGRDSNGILFWCFQDGRLYKNIENKDKNKIKDQTRNTVKEKKMGNEKKRNKNNEKSEKIKINTLNEIENDCWILVAHDMSSWNDFLVSLSKSRKTFDKNLYHLLIEKFSNLKNVLILEANTLKKIQKRRMISNFAIERNLRKRIPPKQNSFSISNENENYSSQNFNSHSKTSLEHDSFNSNNSKILSNLREKKKLKNDREARMIKRRERIEHENEQKILNESKLEESSSGSHPNFDSPLSPIKLIIKKNENNCYYSELMIDDNSKDEECDGNEKQDFHYQDDYEFHSNDSILNRNEQEENLEKDQNLEIEIKDLNDHDNISNHSSSPSFSSIHTFE